MRIARIALALAFAACGSADPPAPADSDADVSTGAPTPPDVLGPDDPTPDAGPDVATDSVADTAAGTAETHDALAPPTAPVRVRSCDTTFRYVPDGPVSTVQLAGEWDWSAPEPMAPDGAGGYERTLTLAPGVHCYKLIVDGEWLRDPSNPYEAWCDGVRNSGARVADCTAAPLLTVDGLERSADGLSAVVLFHAAADGAAPATVTATHLKDFQQTQLAPPAATWDPDSWTLALDIGGLSTGKHTLVLRAVDAEGREAEPVRLPLWIEDAPFEWRDALIYMVLTDRFHNGDPSNDPDPTPGAHESVDWQGGDFAGVIEQIEAGYLDALGVNALWITPPNANAIGLPPGSEDEAWPTTSYHGYWPVSGDQVDPRLGGEDGLRALVVAAHAHGVRVLTDFVINHVHVDHEAHAAHPEWFNDGCQCGTPGCDWTAEATTCLFAPYMPDIDWRREAASEHFLRDGLRWLEEYDLDGLRVDAVKHVDELAVFNLATLVRERLELAGEDIYLVGETAMGWAGDDIEANESEYALINAYLGPTGLDGQFDFVLFHAVAERVFLKREKGLIHLDVWSGLSQAKYVPGSTMVPYFGSHDTPRAISIADYRGQDDDHPPEVASHKWPDQALPEPPDEDEPYLRLEAAFCWLLTMPGAPLVYMGDEYGQPGGHDPDNRRALRFGDDLTPREQDLLAHVQQLGATRAAVPALRRGTYETLGASETFLAFARRDPDTGDLAVVALNVSDEPAVETRELTASGCTDTSCWSEALGFGGALTATPSSDGAGATLQLTLPPRSCAVFVPDA